MHLITTRTLTDLTWSRLWNLIVIFWKENGETDDVKLLSWNHKGTGNCPYFPKSILRLTLTAAVLWTHGVHPHANTQPQEKAPGLQESPFGMWLRFWFDYNLSVYQFHHWQKKLKKQVITGEILYWCFQYFLPVIALLFPTAQEQRNDSHKYVNSRCL